jgi:hypothetical protein
MVAGVNVGDVVINPDDFQREKELWKQLESED